MTSAACSYRKITWHIFKNKQKKQNNNSTLNQGQTRSNNLIFNMSALIELLVAMEAINNII